MIQAFLSGIIGYVIKGVQVVLAPIETAIYNNAPQLSQALGKFSDLLDYVLDFIGYAVDMTGLSPFSIALICQYLVFAFTVPIVVWAIKVFVKWWHAIIP